MVGISQSGKTEQRTWAKRMHVPPSSGDCAQGLDQSPPATEGGRSRFRWQHPEVIENANRHEPKRLTKSADGSRANWADMQMASGANLWMQLHPCESACHSLITHGLASEPPVQAPLRLTCSLRSQRSALTGPSSDAGPISEMREWQAGFTPPKEARPPDARSAIQGGVAGTGVARCKKRPG